MSAPTLTLADPAQAAARQQSAAPLLASLSTLAAAATPLPRPVIEAALKVLATRIDLNQAPPTPAALREAVLGAGVLAQPAAVPTDSKLALVQLRSALVAFLGSAAIPAPPTGRRPPPPLRGEDPRAPSPESPPPDDGTPHDAARTLLSHTDGALSRLKLLQLASQPADARPNPAAPAEYRVEIPMMLGTETGIMQLQIQRDAHNKSQPKARGWRMRFALSFSATGEVGAEVALLGQSASVALWAADPDTADALEAMLPELAPALAARGLDVTGVRLRRGAPQKPARAPGQLLDSAT
ncbi:flagellar hook-length control protein FliK [Devosia sp.]|uniref:flagellar hook-length control protein FliK n=1 Tax=Devosia sp. TaxID=1871048 RepID=UPI003BAD8896